MEQIEKIGQLLSPYSIYIIIGLIILVVILMLVMCISLVRMNKLKKRLDKFMSKEDMNLEELLVEYTGKLRILLQNEQQMKESIEQMKAIVKNCVQKVGVVRYQAIQNMGADLSYTVALLDEANDGVVFNGIYGRDGCYTYAKPIKAGKSTYNLSEEEVEAIEKAIKSSNK